MGIEEQLKYIHEKLDNKCMFIDGLHVQMLIDRSIGNNNKGSKRWINKLFSFNAADFYKNCEKLLEQMYHIDEPELRLYSSVNARNQTKAFREYACKLINNSDNLDFWKSINNQFVSCLMTPENRASNYWLIDLDEGSTAAYNELLKMIPLGCLITSYATPNGWHLITKGFDMRIPVQFPNVEVKRDGLLLLTTLWKQSE